MGFAISTINRIRPRASAGFTLAESLIASVVLAVAAVAIVAPIMAARQQDAAAGTNGTAASLACQLLEEIAAKPFADPDDGNTVPGPGAGETRSLFDNVDDYHGYSDLTTNLTTLGGTSVNLPGNITYTRTVTVEYRSCPSGTAVTSGDFALVTVTVTPSDGAPVKLSQLMTRIPLKR